MDNKENNSPLSGERVEQILKSHSINYGGIEHYIDFDHALKAMNEYADPFKSRIAELELEIAAYEISEPEQQIKILKDEIDFQRNRANEQEAENAKLREALEPLAGAVRHLDTTSMLRTTVVNRLVKLVVAAEQALNSKEV